MRRISAYLLITGFMVSCGGVSEPTKDEKKKDEPVKEEKVEIADPSDIAIDVLNAYKTKDFETLKDMSVPAIGMYFSKANPDREDYINDEIVDTLTNEWDGTIPEVKYMHESEMDKAYAKFMDYHDNKRNKDFVRVVHFAKLNTNWLFWSIDKIEKDKFKEYYWSEIPEEIVSFNYIDVSTKVGFEERLNAMGVSIYEDAEFVDFDKKRYGDGYQLTYLIPNYADDALDKVWKYYKNELKGVAEKYNLKQNEMKVEGFITYYNFNRDPIVSAYIAKNPDEDIILRFNFE